MKMFYNINILFVVLMIINNSLCLFPTKITTVRPSPSTVPAGSVTDKPLAEPAYVSEEQVITTETPSIEDETANPKIGDGEVELIDIGVVDIIVEEIISVDDIMSVGEIVVEEETGVEIFVNYAFWYFCFYGSICIFLFYLFSIA